MNLTEKMTASQLIYDGVGAAAGHKAAHHYGCPGGDHCRCFSSGDLFFHNKTFLIGSF